MKKTCVQCGEEFNISEQEIEHLKENGVDIPDCCVMCRKANRRAARQETSSIRKNSRKSTKLVGIVLVIVFLFLTLWTRNGGNDFLQGLFSNSSKQTEQSLSSQDVTYAFRSFDYLEEHYEKHGIGMGFKSKEEYLAAANKVINNHNALHKKEAEDGDDVYFLESTGELVVLSTDGYIRTYFIPDDGIEYYNRQ
ncbi:MAG: hypothetical protein J5988_02170 [Eubacterium sp.]|nr:hypothetical protein [Eubacterium sp.]